MITREDCFKVGEVAKTHNLQGEVVITTDSDLLEIYADDVKCNHGATVGQLDENALFYLRSRGISEQESRMLLMYAFVHDVLENIRLDALKDRLKLLIEKRLRGELSKCNGCVICK